MDRSLAVDAFITNDPVLKKCAPPELARLVSVMDSVHFDEGQIIFHENDPGTHIYYVLEGSVEVKSTEFTKRLKKTGQYFGQEAAFASSPYVSTAKALTSVETVRVPAQDFARVVDHHHDMRADVFFSMMKKSHHCVPLVADSSDAPGSLNLLERIHLLGGWALLFVLPVITFFLLHSVESLNVRIFISFIAAGMVAWIFELIESYVVGMFLTISALVLRLAPADVILSGYSSITFFMALSFIGLGSILINSGVIYRLFVNILNIIPNTQFSPNFTLFTLGGTLTTMVPGGAQRIEAITPFLNDLMVQTNAQSKKTIVNKMALSAFFGVSLFSSIFLSGSLHNFTLLGLLWKQDQERFQWIGWLQASIVPGIILLIGFAVPFLFILKSDDKIEIDRDKAADQLRVLGPMTLHEKLALIFYAILAFGMITQIFHRFAPQLLGLFVLFAVAALEVMNRDHFRRLIDWPAMFLLGSLVGLINLFNYSRANLVLIDNFGWLGNYIKTNFYVFVLLLLVIVSIVRLVVPYAPTVVLLGTLFMPLAQQYEVNPWTVGFIILLFATMWFYPSQHPPLQEFLRLNAEGHNIDRRTMLYFNWYMNCVKILAVYISIPYWKMLGVL